LGIDSQKHRFVYRNDANWKTECQVSAADGQQKKTSNLTGLPTLKLAQCASKISGRRKNRFPQLPIQQHPGEFTPIMTPQCEAPINPSLGGDHPSGWFSGDRINPH